MLMKFQNVPYYTRDIFTKAERFLVSIYFREPLYKHDITYGIIYLLK